MTAVAASPDGLWATSASQSLLTLWDLKTGRELRSFFGHEDHVTAIAVTPDGERMVSVSKDFTLKVWNIKAAYRMRKFPRLIWRMLSGRPFITIGMPFSYELAVAVMPDGRHAVSGSASSSARLTLWDLFTGRNLGYLVGHENSVTACATTPNGRLLVSTSRDKTLRVWDMDATCTLHILTGHSSEVMAVAVTGDAKRAVSASQDRRIKMWDLATGECLATFTCDSPTLSCAYSDALNLIVEVTQAVTSTFSASKNPSLNLRVLPPMHDCRLPRACPH